MPKWFLPRPRPADFLDPTRTWFQRPAAQFVRTALEQGGWAVMKPPGRLWYHCSFLARKENVGIAVLVSGSDSRLLSTMAKDLSGEAKPQGIVPVLIYGETLDPRVRGWISETSILMHVSEITALGDRIGLLAPVLQGAVDHVRMPDVLSGWAKVTPSFGPTTVQAFFEEEMVGECVADQYREHLTALGDGHFGFKIKLARALDAYEMFSLLVVRAFHGGKYVGRLQIWKQVTVQDASVR